MSTITLDEGIYNILTLDVVLKGRAGDEQLRSGREREQGLVQLRFAVLEAVRLLKLRQFGASLLGQEQKR